MKKNMKVIQINGFRGLVLALFIASCLFAGFIIYPAFMCMFLWNALADKISSVAHITFWAGLLLWAIILLSWIIFGKRKLLVSFKTPTELTDDELDDVISKIKIHEMNKIINCNETNEEQKDLNNLSNNENKDI